MSKPEHHGAGVAHEDRAGGKVVGEESDAQSRARSRRTAARKLPGLIVPVLTQLVGVDEEGGGGDGHDSGGEAVESVDEVHRVGHADDPHHGETGIRSADRTRVVARAAPGSTSMLTPNRYKHGPGEYLARQLGRRRHLPQVVGQCR